jgi:hypothetical protein
MRLDVRVNPRGDVDFVALVDSLVMASLRLEDVERRLRETYPRAVVRRRGLHAEGVEVWYVYRDGSWTPG